jgi:YVTN family beta-propeller protein
MRIALALFCGLSSLLPAQSLVVLNKESATLVVVDTKTGKVSKPVPTGESPHEVDVSADGSTAFVTNYGGRNPGHTLSVIDLGGLVEKHRVDLSPLSKPHGIAVADGKVWFTAEANKVVGRYDPASNRVDSIIGTGQNGTHMVMFDKTRKHMITANIAGDSVSIFTLEANNNWNQVLVPVGRGPEGLDLSPDGTQVWVAHSRDGGVSVIDLASKKVTATFDAATKRSNRIKLTEDGEHALISDLSGNELVIVDAASKKVVKRLAIGKSPEGILIEPGGARAYVAVTGQNEIAVLDLKTLEVITRFQPGAGPDGMAWIATK